MKNRWLRGDESSVNSAGCISLWNSPVYLRDLGGSWVRFLITEITENHRENPQGKPYFEESLRRDESTAGTSGRRNGTIAPLDGSAAADARVSTSCWMYCTNS